MDRFTRTADIIKAYYSYKQTADSATFVKKVCSFFDFIKDESLSDADLNLLLFLANEAGIPQYYDLLKSKFTNAEIGDESINSLTMSALFHDASLIRGDSKLHRYQKHVLDSFVATQRNRYVLTAPTSFGKTVLVYEIIQKMQYQNVLLIFPAISLLSENYARLCSWEAFSDYAIHSLSEEEFETNKELIENEIDRKRAKHAVYENQRTLKAVKALEDNNLELFGQLMVGSHVSLRDDYEVTGIELDTLVSLALKQDGVIGSRMTGAGFGGCTVSIVRNESVGNFIENVTKGYEEVIGYEPTFYVASISNGTRKIG